MIPVNEPLLGDQELEYVSECIRTGWVSSAGRFIDVENPATRTVIASVPRGTDADVDAAVRAAAAAFEGWKRVTPKDRGRMLLRIADLVEAETESLARTVALETGNAIRTQARPEVKSTAEVIRYCGGLAGETIHGDRIGVMRLDGRQTWVRSEHTPWRDANGEIGGLLLMSVDITDMVEAQRLMRAAPKRPR